MSPLIRSVGLRRGAAFSPPEPDPGRPAYSRYRLLVTANNGRGFVGTHDVQLRETAGGPNVATSANGTPIESGHYDLFVRANAFDGDPATAWLVGATFPVYIGFHFTTPRAISQYAVGSYGTSPGQENGSFKDWKLQGSNDGTVWDDLDTRSGEVSWTWNNLNVYTLP